jgi:hypothetical protein
MDVPADAPNDYRTLLADGVVGEPAGDAQLEAWSEELIKLAAADGLHAGLMWGRLDDVYFEANVQLLRRDGLPMGSPNIYPYDHGAKARWHRPRAEAEWGSVLDAARLGAGITKPSARFPADS